MQTLYKMTECKIKKRFYPKICVNHKRALIEICKLWVHFDTFRAFFYGITKLLSCQQELLFPLRASPSNSRGLSALGISGEDEEKQQHFCYCSSPYILQLRRVAPQRCPVSLRFQYCYVFRDYSRLHSSFFRPEKAERSARFLMQNADKKYFFHFTKNAPTSGVHLRYQDQDLLLAQLVLVIHYTFPE